MEFNNDIIDSFLSCKHKAFLKLNGSHGSKTDYELIYGELYRHNKERFLENIKLSYQSEQIEYSKVLQQIITYRSPRLLISPQGKGKNFLITFDVIQIPQSNISREKVDYIPIVISPKEKITKHDIISLAARTILLNRIVPQFPEKGKIIFGKELKVASVRLKDYKRIAQKVIDDLTTLITGNDKPANMRIDGCRTCEFEECCRKYLIERDDLSLMGGLGATEIMKKNKKGIFTINQLSYNCRPKRFKKLKERGRPFSPELKALAIRDKKTYILDATHEIKTEVAGFVWTT